MRRKSFECLFLKIDRRSKKSKKGKRSKKSLFAPFAPFALFASLRPMLEQIPDESRL
jgi:hypothetical protein